MNRLLLLLGIISFTQINGYSDNIAKKISSHITTSGFIMPKRAVQSLSKSALASGMSLDSVLEISESSQTLTCYQYNADGNNIQKTIYEGKYRSPSEKEIYTYDENGFATKVQLYSWNYMKNTWGFHGYVDPVWENSRLLSYKTTFVDTLTNVTSVESRTYL